MCWQKILRIQHFRMISSVNHTLPMKFIAWNVPRYKSYCSKGGISQRIFTPPPSKVVFKFRHNSHFKFALLRKALNAPCSTAGGCFKAVEIGGWIEKAWDHNYTPFQWYVWSCSDSRQRRWSARKLISLQDRPKNTCQGCRFKAITKSNSNFSCWEPKMWQNHLQQAVWSIWLWEKWSTNVSEVHWREFISTMRRSESLQ